MYPKLYSIYLRGTTGFNCQNRVFLLSYGIQKLHGFVVEVLGNSSKLLAAIAGTYGGFYERKTSLQGRANFAKTSQDGTARGHYNSR